MESGIKLTKVFVHTLKSRAVEINEVEVCIRDLNRNKRFLKTGPVTFLLSALAVSST